MSETAEAPSKLAHLAMFYSGTDEYLAGVLGFLRDGPAREQPAFVAVPGHKLGVIRDGLNGQAGRVAFADMNEMGRNPAWIIPKVAAFLDAHAGQAVRYVGEPIWATRTEAEIQEATRHEALINLVFADRAAAILCPYDTARLDAGTLANAEHTHPTLVSGGAERASAAYRGGALFPDECDLPLPPVPADAVSLSYRDDLAAVRAVAAEHARRGGLGGGRTDELVFLVNELATNTLDHTQAHGTLHIWHTREEIIVQVRDRGHIADPLAGRRRPPANADHGHGHGLWLAHQLGDLVELRTGPSGTTIRVHVGVPEPLSR
ncbi:sensor histidine kinase [Sphaerisporangium sp. NPDC088356]|uniref:sensor histidine kinase n=1 Tax=Sphaerisporangium sp. NPDC088356 TaxID=3154871 RepID=UPI00341295F9